MMPVNAVRGRNRQARTTTRRLVRDAVMAIADTRALHGAMICAQLGSPFGRLAWLRGGRDLDHADATGAIRAKLVSGMLPRETAGKTWFGRGSGRPCDGCGLLIQHDQIEVEADFDDPPTIRMHSACFDCWQAERTSLG